MLRKIRIALAVIFWLGITLLLLDFTGALHGWLGWMAKVQFLPAVLALNVAVIVGLVLMSGEGSAEGIFNPEIFSARRIKVAPLVSLFGFLFIMVAIMYRPKAKNEYDMIP